MNSFLNAVIGSQLLLGTALASSTAAHAGSSLYTAAGSLDGRLQQPLDLTDIPSVLANAELAFRHWATQHNRDYLHDPATVQERLGHFITNARLVHEHNSAGASAMKLGLNEFADLSFEEFSRTRLGLDTSLATDLPAALGTFRHHDVETPDEVDWVKKGAVTPIKNQGSCGSCWAFSTTGSIEGINYIDNKELRSISEQELVDCDHMKDHGCGGGLMNNAFQFIIDNGGIDTENDYQYWGAIPSFCNRRKEADRHVVDITGFEQVPQNDEAALAKAVAAQPVSVAICVDYALQLYHSGVYDRACCTGLNHGVLTVGYGTDDGTPYWKVKNSWGPAWGEQGFFRLKKDLGAEGQCGIAMMASYPVKDDKGNPETKTICDPQLFSWWECPAHKDCQCDYNLLGLLCLDYSCVPGDSVAVGEGAYCPSEAPELDAIDGRCYSADRTLNSAPLLREPAHRRQQE